MKSERKRLLSLSTAFPVPLRQQSRPENSRIKSCCSLGLLLGDTQALLRAWEMGRPRWLPAGLAHRGSARDGRTATQTRSYRRARERGLTAPLAFVALPAAHVPLGAAIAWLSRFSQVSRGRCRGSGKDDSLHKCCVRWAAAYRQWAAVAAVPLQSVLTL